MQEIVYPQLTSDSYARKFSRYVFLFIHIGIICWSLYYNAFWSRFIKFATNWWLMLNIAYFVIGVFAQSNAVSQKVLRVHFILYEMTLTGNILVLIVYWNLLFKMHMEEHKDHPIRQVQAIANHLLPQGCIILNFLMDPKLTIPADAIYLVHIMSCYTSVNILDYYWHDRFIYWFMHWKKPFQATAAVLAIDAALILVHCSLHYVMKTL